MSEKPALEADVDNINGSEHQSDRVDGPQTKKARGQLDAAADYLRVHVGMVEDVTEAEMRKVLWKIDLRLMPIMLVTITLAAVDASLLDHQISTTTANNLTEDCHLQRSSVWHETGYRLGRAALQLDRLYLLLWLSCQVSFTYAV